MQGFDPQLRWIEGQKACMASSIERWCALNSGTRNRAGIEAFSHVALENFTPLEASVEHVELPGFEMIDDAGQSTVFETAPAVVLRKRPDARRQVLLAIHLDTVYPESSDFQTVTHLDAERIGGPGVADAKGGIALLATALAAVERNPMAGELGWTVVLNPDEEIGSPCSMNLLSEEAGRADFGLVFEPCLPSGSMISQRKGSGNFVIVVRGRAAHVGRAFDEGRHAIHALADFVHEVAGWNGSLPGVIANTGTLGGGTAPNVVPDFAMARVNVRVEDAAGQTEAEQQLAELAARIRQQHAVGVEIYGAFLSPPKPLDAPMEALMRELERSGDAVGVTFDWQRSGGVCDGNKLAAAGLPNIDTMGPQGGDIHSEREYLMLESLVPRTQLCAEMLLRYAAGEFEIEGAAERREARHR